ncbi:MAG: NeuD/PglB/VioB family sugar acetyltransferase [Elusimicrobia bacterium]|nr:NeuD/PglB/VioB family sugar acetyltransferase [Elusimicrobiota bacterium]
MKEIQKVFIFGAGQNGTQAYHVLKHNTHIEVVGFLDDNPSKQDLTHCGLPVLGTLEEIPKLRSQGVWGALVAVGHNGVRKKISQQIESEGFTLVSAIHPFTFIDSPRSIAPGCIIEMGVTIHPEAVIGKGVFLGGGSIIAHHCQIGDFALIGGGVTFGGQVTIGPLAMVGVGTSLRPGIRIGAKSVIGVGSAVVQDIPDNAVAMGVPAKVTRVLQPEEITVR